MLSKEYLKKLTGTSDVVFKATLYPRIYIMKKILETILDKKIKSIKYLGGELPVRQFIEIGKRLDAYVTGMNSYFDIEVSKVFPSYIQKRNYAFAERFYEYSKA